MTTHDQHTNRLSTEDLLNAAPESERTGLEHTGPEHTAEYADGDVTAGGTGLAEPAEDEVTTGRPATTPAEPDETVDTDRSTDLGRTTETEQATDMEGATETDRADAHSTTGTVSTTGTASTADDESGAPLFAEGEVEAFRTQWRELQAAFVDSPQEAVRDADELVAQIMQNLAATFAEHKRTLEGQWSRGDEVQTEDLRLALRRYRSFFNQLLSV